MITDEGSLPEYNPVTENTVSVGLWPLTFGEHYSTTALDQHSPVASVVAA